MKNRKKFLRYRDNKRKINNYGAYIKSTCPRCDGEELFFYDRYDAICCLYCDEWIDKACGSPECPYCSKRPSTPSEALYFEQERNDIKKDWRRRNYQHKNDGKNRHMRNRELYDDIHSRKKL